MVYKSGHRLMSLICVDIDVLMLVLNIKLVNRSHPIIMYVCIIIKY